MTFQSTSRNQRPKGFNVKQAIQLALLFALCTWLLYQMKHSHYNRTDNDARLQTKLGEEHGAITLGRKGNAGWSSSGSESDSEDRDKGEREKREDGGAGDDKLDRNIEEKAEEVSFDKDNDYGRENAASRVKKEEEKEQEGQYEESQSNEDSNPNTEVEGVESASLIKDTYKKENSNKGHESAKRSMPDHDEEGGDEKDPETQIKEPQNAEKNHTSTSIQYKDQAVKESDENKGPKKIEEKIAVQLGGKVNATLPSQSDMEDGVHVFHDENGVSLDGNDIIESMPKESSGDQKNILHQETISNSNNQTRIIESMPIEGEEVKSNKGSNTADAETEIKGTLEDSKNDKNAAVNID
uniref:Putative myb-like protein X n=1 Tax=Davidia involucrata TaxID=16924 RepID=A0A5B6Z5Q8_DAVIN